MCPRTRAVRSISQDAASRVQLADNYLPRRTSFQSKDQFYGLSGLGGHLLVDNGATEFDWHIAKQKMLFIHRMNR